MGVIVTVISNKHIHSISLPEKPTGQYELRERSYFFRSPRFKRDIDCKKFKIDPPPTSPIAEEMPIFLVIGSSIAMGMMSVITITSLSGLRSL